MRGKTVERGEAKKADYSLSYNPNIPLAVIEAKDNNHSVGAGMQPSWRRVLDYFSSAAQIGMTATPKETKNVSNIEYFGEPIYTYSLRQGISDGFLAPYKVIRIGLDKDLERMAT